MTDMESIEETSTRGKAQLSLSIAVPTYNRCRYLQDLIPDVLRQAGQCIDRGLATIEVVVSDNASTDETQDYLHRASEQNPLLRVHRGQANVGFAGNYERCLDFAGGEYLWVMGDDDLLEPGAVQAVCKHLLQHRPCALIMRDALWIVGVDPRKLSTRADNAHMFPSYGDFLRSCQGEYRQLVPAHTWMPSVVYRRDLMDRKALAAKRHTDYGQVYGLALGLDGGGPVLMADEPFLRMRDVRAPNEFTHNQWNLGLLEVWLGLRYGLPGILLAGAELCIRGLVRNAVFKLIGRGK